MENWYGVVYQELLVITRINLLVGGTQLGKCLSSELKSDL